jgi:UDP-2,3-diacylglucosamine pyrophosphatase LpxH
MATSISRGATGCRFRTVFVSDVHLGCRYTQAEEFLAFLEEIQVERLYIVGDFIDGWRLSRRWRWSPVYVRILQRLVQMAIEGTQVYYAPGNHDEFLRDYLHDFGFVVVADQFVHRTADGRRFVVVHGDKFEDTKCHGKWISAIGAYAYDSLVCANGLVNWMRSRLRLSECRFSSRVKTWARQAVRFVNNFENGLVRHAKELGCQGVICGHVHVPRLYSQDGIVYCNTGDWVEHCSALVEYETGELELVEWSRNRAKLLSPEPDRQQELKTHKIDHVTKHLPASVQFQLPQVIKL